MCHAMERTPCHHSVSGEATMYTGTGSRHDGLCAVAAASWAVWHCLCTEHQAERARTGIHTWKEGVCQPMTITVVRVTGRSQCI